MGRIETFDNNSDLLGRIEHLKLNGVDEARMLVISKENLDETLLSHLDIRRISTEVDTWDRIVAWLADEIPGDEVIGSMPLTPAEQKRYTEEIEAGRLLLHIEDSGRIGEQSMKEKESRRVERRQGASVDEYDYNTTRGDINDMEDFDKDEDLVSRASEGRVESPDRERRMDDEDEERMTLREERLNVDKENVQVGEVGVDKHVTTRLEEFDVPVDREEVTVERRPVDGNPTLDVYSRDDADDDENVMRIPLTEERVKVIKETVVTEEIVIRKNIVTDNQHIAEELRKEEVDITEHNNTRENFDDHRR